MATSRRAPLSLNVKVEGAAALLAEFRKLPKEASAELRVSAMRLSDVLAQRIRAAGAAEGRQAARLTSTVKAKRDRIPAISIGGTQRLFRGKKDGTQQEAFRALFGSEFGGRGHGFKPHRGARGYWVWPTIESNEAAIAAEWKAAAQRITATFSTGMPTHGAP